MSWRTRPSIRSCSYCQLLPPPLPPHPTFFFFLFFKWDAGCICMIQWCGIVLMAFFYVCHWHLVCLNVRNLKVTAALNLNNHAYFSSLCWSLTECTQKCECVHCAFICIIVTWHEYLNSSVIFNVGHYNGAWSFVSCPMKQCHLFIYFFDMYTCLHDILHKGFNTYNEISLSLFLVCVRIFVCFRKCIVLKTQWRNHLT